MIEILNAKKDDMSRVYGRSQIEDKNLFLLVSDIVDNVKKNGDRVLFDYIARLDKLSVDKESILVTDAEIDAAYASVDAQLLESLRLAKQNIYEYHLKQCSRSLIDCSGDSKVGWIIKPVERAGVYVPGGKAAYPSTVLMCVLPAVAAGVKEIVMATPNANPLTLIAARECGVSKIYRMGGAHAIAALAYGTESVQGVDVIAGPGNVYVTMAKKLVFGKVGIDMIAGPSEICIIADDTARAKFIAADLLSQAEHDELAAAILITDSKTLAAEVQAEVERQSALLPRKAIVEQSLKNNGAIILVDKLTEAVDLANRIAPEHLELACAHAEQLAHAVENAGAIFIGDYSPEPLGDYFAGPSHTLPTSGTARHFSVLNVDVFTKRTSYINYCKEDFESAAPHVLRLAAAEGFAAHAGAIAIRLEDTEEE